MTSIRKLTFICALLCRSAAFNVRPSRRVTRPTTLTTNLPVEQPTGGGLFQSAVPLEGDAYAPAPAGKKPWFQPVTTALQSPGASLKNLYQSYLRSIEERPFVTKGLTAAVVNFLGDFLAQYIQASMSGVAFVPNFLRLQTFFLCGLIYIGPFVHSFYEQLWKLGNWMEKKHGSSKQTQAIAQVVVDQTVGCAIFFSTYFYVFEIIDAVVNHRVPMMAAATAKITNNLGSVVMTNYYFWPAINWISFSFVPKELRVLLNNVLGVLWNAFLCTKLAG